MEKLKPCRRCGKPLYIKVKQYSKPILAPLTRAGALRDELIDITGENYVPVEAKYCPVCGRPLGRRAAPENKADPDGLHVKYDVRKLDGTPVFNCFVLRPNKDPSAVVALRAYAEATENKALAEDIYRWVGKPENKPLTLDELRAIQEPTRIWIVDIWGEMEPHYELVGWEVLRACPLTKKLHCISLDGGDDFIDLDSYAKTWLAYARRPEGSETK